MGEYFKPIPEAFQKQRKPDSVGNILRQSHRIGADALEPLRQREHMARPYPSSGFDFLAIDVPSTYQQGLIPDGEEPPWGMLRVVATAREIHGINAGILDAHRIKLKPDEIAEQIQKTRAKVVGLNPTSVNVPEAQVIAQACDKLGVPYILGGIHATLDPRVAREDFPTALAIVRGNGELAIKGAVEAALEPDQTHPFVPGVYFRGQDMKGRGEYALKLSPGEVPMVRQDELVEEPVYEHDVTIDGQKRTIKEATLFVTEGCPFDCTFCASPVMVNRGEKGSKPYSRPPMERILDETTHAVDDLGADAIHFLDDMAFVQEGHVNDLHQGLQSRGLMGKFIWRGLTRAPVIERFSDETMEKMKETGAWKIALGVESGSDEILKQIKKKVTTDQVLTAVRRLASFGIQSKGFFIMGFPGETEEQIQQTRDLLRRLKDEGMTEAAVFQFKPYPGTEEFHRVRRQMPEVIPQLNYLRRSDTGLTGKAQFRVEQHDTWLPDDLRIAAVPSGRVKDHVTAALEDFYGTPIFDTKDSSCQ